MEHHNVSRASDEGSPTLNVTRLVMGVWGFVAAAGGFVQEYLLLQTTFAIFVYSDRDKLVNQESLISFDFLIEPEIRLF